MSKKIKDNLKRIGDVLLQLIVNILVDSIGLYCAVNVFLMAFNFSVQLKFIQAFAIMLLVLMLSAIFGGKEQSK